MKNKRKLKLKKYLFLAPLGLTAIIIPITLSSCANISQYVLPIVTGDLINGPYAESANDWTDFFGGKYSDYVGNNYISYINRSSGNSVMGYGYMNSQDIAHTNSDNFHDFKNFGYGYYGINDEKLRYANKDDKNSIVRSYQNINQICATNSISSISTTLSSLLNTMIHFVSQSGVVTSDTHRGQWINKLLDTNETGDAWHGNKDGTDAEKNKNEKFYEFLFDTNNLLSTGNVPYRFDVASQEFSYIDNPFVDKLDTLGADTFPADSNTLKYNVYSNKSFNPSDSTNVDKINPYVQAYASYADCGNKNSDGNTYHYLSNFAYSIPSVVHIHNDGDAQTSQFTYFDPRKNHGYIPNEYLDVDMNKVLNKINKTDAWKKIDNLIGNKGAHKNIKDISKRYGVSVNEDSLTSTSSTIVDYEPGLEKILEDVASSTFNKSDFLVLNSYTVLSYKLPTDDKAPSDFYKEVTDANGNDKDGNDARNVHVPIFYGSQQNVFPIGLLFKSDGTFDDNLLKQQTKAIWLDPKTGKARDGHDNDSDKLKYLDLDKLNDKFAQFMIMLTTPVNNETNPDNYQIKYHSKYHDGKYLSQDEIHYFQTIFKNIFGKSSSNDWIKPIQ